MNKISYATALGLSMGLVGGCADFTEPEIRQPAAIVGYFNGIDVTVVTDELVHYEGQEEVPYSEAQNIKSYDVQDGCTEIKDFSGFSFDDPDCFGEWCFSDEDSYCVPKYTTNYDYDRLEEVDVRYCPAKIIMREYQKSEPEQDSNCQSYLKDGQRFNRISRFLIKVRTKNPQYGLKDHNSASEFIERVVEITADEWQSTNLDTKADAVIQGQEIVEVELNFSTSQTK